MNIKAFEEDIKKCRFCFMCRHLSGVGNVTFREADGPRIRASLCWGAILDAKKLTDPDFVETIYSSDLSAAGRFHCVNHYDEAGIVLAARRDIVENGDAPEDVRKLAGQLQARPAFKATGKGDVLYYVDADTEAAKTEEAAFAKLAKKAGVAYQTAKGGTPGKGLYVLGYRQEAQARAAEFAAALDATGAKTVVVSSPAVYDCLVNDYKAWGVKLAAKVLHVSEFIAKAKLRFTKKVGVLQYLESDFLKNYCGNLPFPREVLKQLKAESPKLWATDLVLQPCAFMFGTNNEESYTCGEGAVVYDRLRPEIAAKMAAYVQARLNAPEDLLVVSSPYTRNVLAKAKVNVKTLTELAAGSL
ncbi:MAG: hypothetical protein ACI4RD_04980 [Kiritimatiellia bacterium]